MREIKFRAWIREGEWDEAGEKQAYKMCYDLAFEDFEPINDLLARVENLMQYTGLKDRNGREIYEGDIVQRYGEGRYSVYWHEPTASFSMDGHWGITRADMGLACEVIGNICENPELLKV